MKKQAIKKAKAKQKADPKAKAKAADPASTAGSTTPGSAAQDAAKRPCLQQNDRSNMQRSEDMEIGADLTTLSLN